MANSWLHLLIVSYDGIYSLSHMHAYRIRDQEVVYEVIAEPQEQTEPAPQAFRDDPAQGPVDTSTEQQPAGKPGAHPFISNYDTYIKFLLLVH